MREFNSREKNLGVICVAFLMLVAWWYVARMLKKEFVFTDAERFHTLEQVRQTGASLAQMQIALDKYKATMGPIGVQAVSGKLSTMTMLKDLTIPSESMAVKLVSMTRHESGAFQLDIEGEFGSMMRFLSYLEREKSQFSLGNVSLLKTGSTDATLPSANGPRVIRANVSLMMKG